MIACSAKLKPAPPYSSGSRCPAARAGCPRAARPARRVRVRVHQLAHPGQRRPVGQEPAHRLAQFDLLGAHRKLHGCAPFSSDRPSTSSASIWSPFTHSGLTSSESSAPPSDNAACPTAAMTRGQGIQVGRDLAPGAGQQREPAQLAEHPTDFGLIHRQHAQAYVLQHLDPDPAEADREHRPEVGSTVTPASSSTPPVRIGETVTPSISSALATARAAASTCRRRP